MRKGSRFPTWTAAIAFVLCLTAGARAEQVVAFGDSWAAFYADDLAATFDRHGHPDFNVSYSGIPGGSAEGFAAAPSMLPDAVTLNNLMGERAQYVWLSISGNDALVHYASGRGGSLVADNEANIRAMLDALFAVHSEVHVVMFGYDFLNYWGTAQCGAIAWEGFGLNPYLVPQHVAPLNSIYVSSTNDVQAAIAADYPNVTYVDVLGTLQAKAGVPNAPDFDQQSPVVYYGEDCIHPNDAGVRILMDEFYDEFWKAELGGGCGVVSRSGSGPCGALAVALGGAAIARFARRRS